MTQTHSVFSTALEWPSHLIPLGMHTSIVGLRQYTPLLILILSDAHVLVFKLPNCQGNGATRPKFPRTCKLWTRTYQLTHTLPTFHVVSLSHTHTPSLSFIPHPNYHYLTTSTDTLPAINTREHTYSHSLTQLTSFSLSISSGVLIW